MANVSENNKISRLSYMNLEEAFTLFLSYHEDTTEYSMRDPYRRKQFKELLCHANYGLGVYIVSGEYILLKSRDIDLGHFLTYILSSKKDNFYNRADLNDEKFIEDLLNVMDTAFDKKVTKVILGTIKTRSELEKIGIGGKIGEYTKEVLDIVERRKEVTLEAKHMDLETLNLHVNNLESKIENEEECLDKNRGKWSDENVGEQEELVEDLKQRLEDKKLIIEKKRKRIKKHDNTEKKKVSDIEKIRFEKSFNRQTIGIR